MAAKYTIPLQQVIQQFSLETLFLPPNIDEILVERSDINRPGLPLTGFFDHFEAQRIQVIGNVEHQYLAMMSSNQRQERLRAFFARRPVAVVICKNLSFFEEMRSLAREFSIPILRATETTSAFTAALIGYLSVELAPRITRHGVLVEVYGEGLLILGDSGVGKSEAAIELLKRGHRLIADDAVEIKRVSAQTLVGSAPELIRHYVELRGIGVVDVRRLFGMGAVKLTEKIDLIVQLELWEQGKMYDRLGAENHTMEIMGISVPALTIPVKSGRNLAVILEVAAMNHRQKKMGYNTAEELNRRLESLGAQQAQAAREMMEQNDD